MAWVMRPDIWSVGPICCPSSAALSLGVSRLFGRTRCFIRGLLRLLRRPSPAVKPAVGMPIPELSDRLREKACPSLLNIKLYCIVYIRRRRDDRRDRARKVAELAEICGRQHNAQILPGTHPAVCPGFDRRPGS